MRNAWLVLLVTSIGSLVVVAGCGGNEDACAAASEHVMSCTGVDAGLPEKCGGPDEAQFADELLGTTCEDLQSRSATALSPQLYCDPNGRAYRRGFLGMKKYLTNSQCRPDKTTGKLIPWSPLCEGFVCFMCPANSVNSILSLPTTKQRWDAVDKYCDY